MKSWPFYFLVLAVVLTPLPFGSVYQWSWSSLGLIVALLLGHSSMVLVYNRGSLSHPLRGMLVPGGLYLLVVTWVAFQGSETSWISWANPLWAESSELLNEDTRLTISLDPYRTWSECLKMLTFGGIFWLAALYGRDRDRARVALWAVALAGALYALYGLVAQFTEFGAYLWFGPMPNSSGVSSTFVNRNMYADYAGFGILTSVALLLGELARLLNRSRHRTTRWKDVIRGQDSQILLLAICALVLVAALLLTTSRGGIAASMVALGCLLGCSAWQRQGNRPSGHTLARFSYAVLALVVAGYVIAGGDLGGRLMTSSSLDSESRFQGYSLIWEAISDSPIVGYGAGTALDVFYLYNDGRFWKAFNYAHNHYLGSAVELGLPATAVLLVAVGMIGLTCLKGVRRRRHDQMFPALGVSVLVLVAVHGLVDSPLRSPANAATFSFLMGLAYAQAWPTRQVSPKANSPTEPDRAVEAPRELSKGQSE